MTWNGLIQANELALRLEEEAGMPAADRRLRVFDATVVFERGEKGIRAVPGREAYAAGHIPEARFVDHQADLSRADSPYNYTLLPPDELQEALRALGICNDSRIVVYSTSHVMWATRLWWVLRSCGLRDVSVLDGGIAAWKEAGLPLSSEEIEYPRGDVTIDFSPLRWADRAEVEAAIGDGSVCTLNALTAEMHRGDSQTHYGRPGHIRGSVNVPFDDFLIGGKLRPEAELRERLNVVDAFSKERVVTYCGGGIAATLAAFALHQLGHANVGVYDGSLSEWGADPGLPMDEGD